MIKSVLERVGGQRPLIKKQAAANLEVPAPGVASSAFAQALESLPTNHQLNPHQAPKKQEAGRRRLEARRRSGWWC